MGAKLSSLVVAAIVAVMPGLAAGRPQAARAPWLADQPTADHILAVVPHEFPDQFWLAGPSWRPGQSRPTAVELAFAKMLAPGALSASVGERINTVILSEAFYDKASDAQLRALVGEAKDQGKSLGVDASLLVSPSGCGDGTTSSSPAELLKRVLHRVELQGGEIDTVSLQAPVWFARQMAGPAACRETLRSVAAQMAGSTRIFEQNHNAVSFVDTEIFDAKSSASELAEVLRFVSEFHAATGFVINQIHAAPVWSDATPAQLRTWRLAVERAGIGFGFVVGGPAGARSDTQWTATAVRRIRAALSLLAPGDIAIVVQADGFRPTRLLPDTGVSALTSIVRRTPTRLVRYKSAS